ncbi:serine hydrolase [Flammeovirgaceae bacterium SG7u.111]|nr:serine hydrolase [Flammeovirgaceae bacterium SG7u.132]WPO35980.1 serine hydrolase [Flammeovirgaceae bacterium SG7u.111]
MKKLILLSIFLSLISCQPDSKAKEELTKRIADNFAKVEGTFAVAFQEVGKPETAIFINEKEVFHAASTMKTSVMIEAFKQDAEGRLSLSDSVLVKNEFKSMVDSSVYELTLSDDSESELYQNLGEKMPLGDLVYKMIIKSSNLATNLMVEIVGAQNTTASMRKLGAPDIEVLRGVEDIKAYRQGFSNTTTAYDLMVIFDKMGQGKAVNKEVDEKMIGILLDQKFNEMIPAKLPKDVKVAHKTGWITGVHHDSGIVILPDGRRYVLVILSKELTNEEKGVAKIAEVSGWIYQYFTENL